MYAPCSQIPDWQTFPHEPQLSGSTRRFAVQVGVGGLVELELVLVVVDVFAIVTVVVVIVKSHQYIVSVVFTRKHSPSTPYHTQLNSQTTNLSQPSA